MSDWIAGHIKKYKRTYLNEREHSNLVQKVEKALEVEGVKTTKTLHSPIKAAFEADKLGETIRVTITRRGILIRRNKKFFFFNDLVGFKKALNHHEQGP